jgi:nucleoside-diphosphate-sugar epimerase
VYGPNVRANFQSLLSIGNHQRPLPFAGIKNQRSFVYVENLVDFIHRCLDHPNAANECFLVSDDQDLSTPELIQACAKALGVKERLFYVPQSLLHLFLKVIGKEVLYLRLCGDLTVEISKAKRLLGWRPPFSVETGLAETAKAFK